MDNDIVGLPGVVSKLGKTGWRARKSW